MRPTPAPLTLDLSTGRFRAHSFGLEGGRLTLCVHGLSANSRSFDFLGEELASADRRVVAIDLRGRGFSQITGPGSHGWKNHARDLLEAATRLGATRFDYVGHSMGAFIGMEVATMAPERVESLVLIDAVGVPEVASLVPILAAVQRLGSIHADADAYVAKVKSLGTIAPWGPVWETHYRYDLIAASGGVRPRTDHAAVLEDIAYGAAQQPRDLWPRLTMKTLLVRAGLPLGAGFIVSAADRAEFLRQAPRGEAVDVEANHYGVIVHPRTAEAIRSFLS